MLTALATLHWPRGPLRESSRRKRGGGVDLVRGPDGRIFRKSRLETDILSGRKIRNIPGQGQPHPRVLRLPLSLHSRRANFTVSSRNLMRCARHSVACASVARAFPTLEKCVFDAELVQCFAHCVVDYVHYRRWLCIHRRHRWENDGARFCELGERSEMA